MAPTKKRKIFMLKAQAARWAKNDMPATDAVNISNTTLEENTLGHDCSFSKKVEQSKEVFPLPEPSKGERIILDLDLLLAHLNKYTCPTCGGVMSHGLNASECKGFVKNIEGRCSDCDGVTSFYTSGFNEAKSQKSNNKPFTINNDVVAASMALDMGPYKLNRFCEHLNLSGLHQKSFKKITRDLHSNMIQTGNSVFTKSATIVRNVHKKSIEDPTPLDIAVSFDGTWLTRGHSSLIGLSTVIEVETGSVRVSPSVRGTTRKGRKRRRKLGSI